MKMENDVLTICRSDTSDHLVVVACDKSAESVEIPNGNDIFKIDFWAFKDCTSLRYLKFNSDLSRISDAFVNCVSLETLEFDGTMSMWRKVGKSAGWNKKLPAKCIHCSDGDIIFEGDDGLTIENGVLTGCERYMENVEIPKSVTSIGERAFWQCDELSSVVIPSSVTEIGEAAFGWCDSLQSVIIPESVTEIARAAFVYCRELSSVVIPPSVTEIREYTFCDCKSLPSVIIPEGVTKIGENAFVSCESLKSIVIPSTVTEIDEAAFEYCDAIEKIESSSPLFPFDEKKGKLYDARGKRKKPMLLLRKTVEKNAKIKQIHKAKVESLFLSAINEQQIQDASAKIIYSTNTYDIVHANVRENNVLFKVSVNERKWMNDVPKIMEALADMTKSPVEIFDALMQTALPPTEITPKIADNINLVTSNGKVRLFCKGIIHGIYCYDDVKALELVGMTEIAHIRSGSIESLTIPDGVKKIGILSFAMLEQILFAGTLAQWNAVEKDKNWNTYCSAKSVKCTDGEVELKAEN